MSPYTITRQVHLHRGRQTRRELRRGPAPVHPTGHTPRISKLMALALHFADLVARGQLADYATVARLGQVSRARLTQIMNLTLLAPDLQEELLFRPLTRHNRDGLTISLLQPLAREPDWQRQRVRWARLKAQLPLSGLMPDAGGAVEAQP